jgi:Zn-dependent protease
MDHAIRLAVYMVVLIYSCIFHEVAHVWIALKLGDPTGKLEGRLTLNPIRHIDPFWTIILPVLTYVTAGFPIGGPKPAPVNPLNFRDPRSGHMWTALAGPATNLLLAGVALILVWILHSVVPGFFEHQGVAGDEESPSYTLNTIIFANIIFTNVILAVFNLIPMPPLDGSRFLSYVIGRTGAEWMRNLERLGPIPVFIAAYFLSPYVIGPCLRALATVLTLIVDPRFASVLIQAYFQR